MKVCSLNLFLGVNLLTLCTIDSAKLHLHWKHEVLTHLVTNLLKRQKERERIVG